MTMNLTARYYTTSREFVVIDRRRADVAAIAASFANDWAGGGLPPSSPAALVWSPGAQDALVALIALGSPPGARRKRRDERRRGDRRPAGGRPSRGPRSKSS